MKRQQSILAMMTLAALALVGAACSKTATNSNNANTSVNTSNTTANTTTTTTNTANTTANTSTPTPPSTANSSPMATFRAVYDAFRNKDAAALKKTMASADLKALEERSKKNGESADGFLKMLVESPDTTPPAVLEMRNEKINGDKATVEVKDEKGNWDKISFLKEGDEWKVVMFGEDADEK
jgi:hypothetical protein